MINDTRTVTLNKSRLKRLRLQKGWTQERLAEELKCTKKTVQNWERGNPVYLRNARQLETLFGQKLTISESVDECFQIATKPPVRDQDRVDLIETVRRDWLQPILSDSLTMQREVLLNLKAVVDVVDHPSADLPISAKPPMDGIGADFAHQAFKDFGRTLLILGMPGAGKTTLMFQLAEILVDEAELKETAPIPVVFFLSSWNAKRGRIHEWLIEELVRRYPLSMQLASDWVREGLIIPLLDGLDEVAPEQRSRCLTAINTFFAEQRKTVGSVSTIVCCRTETYSALEGKLRIGGAILIRPLSRDKIETYMSDHQSVLAGADKALKADPTLIELIDNPLMLSVLIKACQGHTSISKVAGDNKQRQNQWLFDAYVNETFRRRGQANEFQMEDSIIWLAQLAQLMRKNREKVFYLDSIQPSWLDNSSENDYVVLMSLLIAGLSVGLLFGTSAWLALGQKISVFIGALLGLFGPFLFWRFGYGDEIHPVETLRWSPSSFANRGREVISGAFLFGAIFGIFAFVASGPLIGAIVCVLSSVLFATFFGIPGRTSSMRTIPNQRIRRSLLNCLATTTISTGLFGVLFSLWLEAAASLAFGLSFGVVTGLFNGGHACIQHGVLRYALWRNRTTPVNYLSFLQFSAKVALLRQVGGGFMFIHDLLEEHFANKVPGHEHSKPAFGRTNVNSSDRE